MTDNIATMLEQIAVHLEADGQDREAIGYSKAADTLRRTNFIPANPSELDGVGSTIRDDIIEYQQTGESSKLDALREKHPYLEPLCRVDGIGPKTARRIHDELGIETPEEIVEQAPELTRVPRVGEKTALNLIDAAKDLSSQRT